MRAGDIAIGGLSRQTGVHIETIRYYERIGVMPQPPRTSGGQRIYDQSHVKRLSFIARSRNLGFSLQDIRGLLSLVDNHSYSCADVQHLTLDHAKKARRKIADLRKLEQSLRGMAAQCHGNNVPDCPIIDALFEAPARKKSSK